MVAGKRRLTTKEEIEFEREGFRGDGGWSRAAREVLL
jgi:hypothetical protein